MIEYNKAIEGFEMLYHPNSEDVFRIIVQISRFLKEFSVNNLYDYLRILKLTIHPSFVTHQ